MNKSHSIRSILFLIGVLVVTLTFTSCSRKTSFLISNEVPAAEGNVKVKKSSNNNYEINVKIRHLAEPDRLKPPKEVYVVWMETENNRTENLGQIQSSSGFLSKQLKASFTTVTPYNPVKIFITAEKGAKIQYPQGVVILTTDNF